MRRSTDGLSERNSALFKAFREIPPYFRMEALESLLVAFNPLDEQEYKECLLSEVAKKMIYHSRTQDEVLIRMLKSSILPDEEK